MEGWGGVCGKLRDLCFSSPPKLLEDTVSFGLLLSFDILLSPYEGNEDFYWILIFFFSFIRLSHLQGAQTLKHLGTLYFSFRSSAWPDPVAVVFLPSYAGFGPLLSRRLLSTLFLL